MASNLRNSDAIADLVATPRVKAQPTRGGTYHRDIAVVSMVNADSAPSTQTMLRVPAHARVSDLKISNTAVSTSGTLNIGAYAEAAASPGVISGAAISAAFFAAAVSIVSAQTKVSILNQSTTNTPQKQTQPLWQALGVATAPVPGTFYLITAEVVAALGGNGDVLLEIEYQL